MNLGTEGSIVIYFAYFLVGLSVFWVARALLKEEESRNAQEGLEDSRNRKSTNRLVQTLRPLLSQYIVPAVRSKSFWDERRKEYRRKIISAGLKDEITADEFISLKYFGAVVLPLLVLAYHAPDFKEISPLMFLGSILGGWFAPNLWVKLRLDTRHHQIRKSMPFVIDLLALSTEAGLDFVGAIGKVVEKSKPGPLIDELEQILKEIRVGSSRADALREMSLRINMPEMNSFVAILISADQMGAPIGRVLREQSEQIRNQRFIRAEKLGAAASAKVIMPTIFLIMPAVLIITLGPLIPGCISGGGGGLP